MSFHLKDAELLEAVDSRLISQQDALQNWCNEGSDEKKSIKDASYSEDEIFHFSKNYFLSQHDSRVIDYLIAKGKE